MKKGILLLMVLILVGCSKVDTEEELDNTDNLLDVMEDDFKDYWNSKVEEGIFSEEDSYQIREVQILAGDNKEFMGSVTYEKEYHTNEGNVVSDETYYSIMKKEKNTYRNTGNLGVTDLENTELEKLGKIEGETYRKYDVKEVHKNPFRYRILNSVEVTFDNENTWVEVPKEYGSLALIDDSTSREERIMEEGIYQDEQSFYIMYGGVYNWNTDKTSSLQILYTKDQGKSWHTSTVLENTISTYRNIFFIDENTAYVVTSNALSVEEKIARTDDGGETWQEVPSPKLNQKAYQISVYDTVIHVAYKSLSEPVLYRSDDNGSTWIKVILPVPEEFKKHYVEAQVPIMTGQTGYVYVSQGDEGDYGPYDMRFETKDGGHTWQFVREEEKVVQR